MLPLIGFKWIRQNKFILENITHLAKLSWHKTIFEHNRSTGSKICKLKLAGTWKFVADVAKDAKLDMERLRTKSDSVVRQVTSDERECLPISIIDSRSKVRFWRVIAAVIATVLSGKCSNSTRFDNPCCNRTYKLVYLLIDFQ